MENSPAKIDQTKHTGISLHIKDLAIRIADVNKLVQMPLSGPELIRWSDDINRLAPGATPEMISYVMDCFKIEKLEWDRNKGIQNIFNALKLIKVDDTGNFNLLISKY